MTRAIKFPRTFKRGTTFKITLTVTKPDGAVQDITNWQISSQLRDQNGALVQSFTIVKSLPLIGEFTINATPVQTSTWVEGYHLMDVKLTDENGVVMSTTSLQIHVEQGPTQ